MLSSVRSRQSANPSRRSTISGLALLATFLIAGCAHRKATTGINDAKNRVWAGRISVQIDSEPSQAFSAGFELEGQAERGVLTLTSPIGSVLGVMRWSPTDAILETSGNSRRFDSVDGLLEQTTGAAIPVSAIFDWLDGKNTQHNGWMADLSRHGDGRINAVRLEPTPQTRLRIVLDQ